MKRLKRFAPLSVGLLGGIIAAILGFSTEAVVVMATFVILAGVAGAWMAKVEAYASSEEYATEQRLQKLLQTR